MKKTICILLMTLMALGLLLTSCNNAGDESVADVSAGPTAYVPHLGETDAYKGKVLTVLSTHEGNNYSKEAFSTEEITNEPINDASYNRDIMLEENYGFTVDTVWEDAGNLLARVRDDRAAGIDNYDVVVSGLQSLATLAAEGFFLDLNSLGEESNLRLDQPWWDQPFNEDMSVAGKLYFATGDIVMLDDEYTRCILYNKDLIEDNNLESPAQLVYDHKWTLDALYEMAKLASHEGDGDGAMTVTGGDVWGLVQASFESYTLILGSDCPLVSKDDEDIPRLAMMDARNVEAFEKVWEICTDRETTAYTEQWYSWNAPDAYKVCENFQKGQALFYTITVIDMQNHISFFIVFVNFL